MINYTIGDFLIRIKNMALSGHKDVVLETSKLKYAVALVLKELGYLREVTVKNRQLTATLAYKKKKPVIMDLKLVSKPGLRVYMDAKTLAAKRGPSVYILSTSKGVKSSKKAIKQGIGGEVIAEAL